MSFIHLFQLIFVVIGVIILELALCIWGFVQWRLHPCSIVNNINSGVSRVFYHSFAFWTNVSILSDSDVRLAALHKSGTSLRASAVFVCHYCRFGDRLCGSMEA